MPGASLRPPQKNHPTGSMRDGSFWTSSDGWGKLRLITIPSKNDGKFFPPAVIQGAYRSDQYDIIYSTTSLLIHLDWQVFCCADAAKTD